MHIRISSQKLINMISLIHSRDLHHFSVRTLDQILKLLLRVISHCPLQSKRLRYLILKQHSSIEITQAKLVVLQMRKHKMRSVRLHRQPNISYSDHRMSVNLLHAQHVLWKLRIVQINRKRINQRLRKIHSLNISKRGKILLPRRFLLLQRVIYLCMLFLQLFK